MAKNKVKKPVKKKAVKRKEQPAAMPTVVVFFELSGVAGVRFHDEFVDVDRARLAARALVSSPDVAQAWIMQDLEIVRKPGAVA